MATTTVQKKKVMKKIKRVVQDEHKELVVPLQYRINENEFIKNAIHKQKMIVGNGTCEAMTGEKEQEYNDEEFGKAVIVYLPDCGLLIPIIFQKENGKFHWAILKDKKDILEYCIKRISDNDVNFQTKQQSYIKAFNANGECLMYTEIPISSTICEIREMINSHMNIAIILG